MFDFVSAYIWITAIQHLVSNDMMGPTTHTQIIVGSDLMLKSSLQKFSSGTI